MKLQGKVAIVTGGARGLGRAYVLRLASLGADIGVLDVDLDGAAKFGEQLSAASIADEVKAAGRRCFALQVNLADRDQATRAIDQIVGDLGRVDVLVNNAGGAITPIDRSMGSVCPDEDIAAIFEANLWSTIYCCQAVAPSMKAQNSGIIINTSSISGHSIASGGRLAMYGMSKAAITHYTRNLAVELGPHGIRVNCIAPGIMMTARVKAQAQSRKLGLESELQHIALRRFGEVEDCAGVVEFLATDLSRYVTGQCIAVCGGSLLAAH